jgi:hypothetical protein
MEEIVNDYKIKSGDVLRLRQNNPYCKSGKYAVLSLDTTVCLARTQKHQGDRVISNDFIYVAINDLSFFKRTKTRIRPVF